jgi:hypothetical protein
MSAGKVTAAQQKRLAELEAQMDSAFNRMKAETRSIGDSVIELRNCYLEDGEYGAFEQHTTEEWGDLKSFFSQCMKHARIMSALESAHGK